MMEWSGGCEKELFCFVDVTLLAKPKFQSLTDLATNLGSAWPC
jgi:hypothetical protein